MTRILEAALRARRDADITARLNAVFSQVAAGDEQRKTARRMDEAGTTWAEEGW